MRRAWYVYVLRCGDGTLYTGVTPDLSARLDGHRAGRGARYTRGRGPLGLQYWEAHPDRAAAQSREAALKRLPRAAKLALPHDPSIRPAAAGDLPFFEETIRRFDLDPERLSHEQFVVAVEDGERAGFARIKPYAGCFELGSVAVLEGFRRRGIGARLVRHLVARFPTRNVWITTHRAEYFQKLGFAPAEPPRDLRRKIERICHARYPDVVAMKTTKSRVHQA